MSKTSSIRKGFTSVISRLRLALAEIQKISPKFIFVLILNAFVQSAQIALAVFIPKLLLDALMRQIVWADGLYIIAGIAFAEILLKLSQNALQTFINTEQVRVEYGMNKVIAEKVTRLPYSSLEDTEVLNLKESASFAMTNQNVPASIIRELQQILRYFLTLIMLLSILSQLSWILVAFLLLSFMAIALLQNLSKRHETNFFKNVISVNRKYGYYIGRTLSEEIQQQVRLYGLRPMLSEKVSELNLQIADWLGIYTNNVGKITAAQSIITDLQTIAAYAYAAFRVLSTTSGPAIGIGSFSLYAGAAIQFTSAMRELFSSVRNIKQHLDFLEPFQQFMALPEDGAPLEAGGVRVRERFANITFDNVTFTYPKAEQAVLQDVSFTINEGEKISIVGLNGAGKTTLVKLLCRFYKPNSGRILVNGRDIWTWNEQTYLREIAAVFQDFRLLSFSIQSNITSLADDVSYDVPKLEKIMNDSSVASIVGGLEQGAKTLLNKAINREGTELSGGQAQKIAIARALYKEGSLVILDEPTSALDPLAEAEIYEHFDTLVQGQTAIYISHRMSSSRFCDKVLVLNEGKVSAFAHHDELMRTGDSLYRKLFEEQARYYKFA